MNSNNHPIYGNFEYNVWKPLYFHKTNKKTKEHEFGKHPNYEILFIDNKEKPFTIRNIKRNSIIKSHYGYYTLAKDGINITYSETHIAVASAFPHITPKETIDHINDDPNDNRITNLMWMERSENSKKGQKKAKDRKAILGKILKSTKKFEKDLDKKKQKVTSKMSKEYQKQINVLKKKIAKVTKDLHLEKKKSKIKTKKK